MMDEQPHQPPEYTGPSSSSSTSAATTLHHGTEHHQRPPLGAEHSTTGGIMQTPASQPILNQTPSFAQPSAKVTRKPSRSAAPYPVLGQQPSQLARQASTASNRPSSPHFPHAALALSRSVSAPGATYIEWAEGDPQCPIYWSNWKRWKITLVCASFAAATALLATGYNAVGPQVEAEFGVSQTVFLLGNTTYLVMVAFAPLVLAPFSELIGRQWIFNLSALITALMMIPQALAPNIYAILIPRIVMGASASCGNSLVGGIIADMFPSNERGLPMSLFAWTIFTSQGLGPLCSSYATKAHGWRVSFWWQGAVALMPWVLMMLLFEETRGPVLLSRRAAKMTKEAQGKVVYRCRADDERVSVTQMIITSVSRPVIYLTTEPIVTSWALFTGFLWATVFLSVAAVPIAFGDAYNWTSEQSSIVLLILGVGASFGVLLNLWQEHMYARATKKYNGEPPPEVRLYSSCIGAVLIPIGLLWYAWGCQSHVHPAVPIIGLVIFAAAVFQVYLAIFVVLSGIYGRYASSALAAQSWLRNVLAGVAPLFTPALYNNLGPPYATTLLACIAALLGACPFVLYFFGPSIRARSRVAKAMQREEQELEEQMQREREREERRKLRQEKKDAWLAEANKQSEQRHHGNGVLEKLHESPSKTSADADIERNAAKLEQS